MQGDGILWVAGILIATLVIKPHMDLTNQNKATT